MICCLCLLIYPAIAQVKFSAQASTKDMGKSDYVEIQFVVENAKDIANLQPPEFADFTIIQGPSQSTGMSVVNGNMTQYRGISYLLQPKKTGTLIIKPATATVDGQQMHTNPIQITVHNTGGQANRTPGFSPLPDPVWPAAQPPVDMDEVVRPEKMWQKKSTGIFLSKWMLVKQIVFWENLLLLHINYMRGCVRIHALPVIPHSMGSVYLT